MRFGNMIRDFVNQVYSWIMSKFGVKKRKTIMITRRSR